jgi:hypothetical protein
MRKRVRRINKGEREIEKDERKHQSKEGERDKRD